MVFFTRYIFLTWCYIRVFWCIIGYVFEDICTGISVRISQGFLYWLIICWHLFFSRDMIWGIFEDYSRSWFFTYSSYGSFIKDFSWWFYFIFISTNSPCWSFLEYYTRWSFYNIVLAKWISFASYYPWDSLIIFYECSFII